MNDQIENIKELGESINTVTKPWYLSRTIVASLVTIFLAVASYLGVDLGSTDQNEVVNNIFQIITAICGLISILGRIRAKKAIQMPVLNKS